MLTDKTRSWTRSEIGTIPYVQGTLWSVVSPRCTLGGIYYVRFLRGDKRVWRAIGPDADTAIVAVRNLEHDLQSISLGRSTLAQPRAQFPEFPAATR